jgi:AraC-like DNA-binding protein
MQSQNDTELHPLAFGNTRAVKVSQLDFIVPVARASTGMQALVHLEPLAPDAPPVAAFSGARVGEVSLLAMSTTGIRFETDGWSRPKDKMAVILPTKGTCTSSLWGEEAARAGSSFGIAVTARGRRLFTGFWGAALTVVNIFKLRETWLAMLGPRAAERNTFPDVSRLTCISSAYGKVDFARAFTSIFTLIDHFDGQEEALRKLNLDDTIHRTIAAALTPELFWGDEVVLSKGSNIKRRSVDAICDRLRADPSAPLSLTEMEKISGYSKRTLQNAFQARFGMSPIEWQINERLLIAGEMLKRQPDLTIAHVAQQTGFASTSSFSQYFKATFGTTPSKLRRSAA